MPNVQPRRAEDPAGLEGRGIILAEVAADARLDLHRVFGNRRPVELEIGTGKGTFLKARATARPECNFIGMEWAREYCNCAADRLARAGLTNVRMLRADAATFVRRHLGDQSIIRVHIYFPDPWPKQRHHGRRLIQVSFVAELRRILRPGGQLLVVTDHLSYYRHIQRVLALSKGWATVPFPSVTALPDEIVGTNFERKYRREGRAFYSLARIKYG